MRHPHISRARSAQVVSLPATTFVVRLRAGPDNANPVCALRLLLKTALRRHGLKCIGAIQVQDDE